MSVREQTFTKLLALLVSFPVALAVVLLVSGAGRSSLIPKFRHAQQTEVEYRLDLSAAGEAVSPDIYGVAAAPPNVLRALDAKLNRWGGNTSSRYNWKQGNVWNVGSDWFFENQAVEDNAWRVFLSQTLENDAKAIMTIPLVGYVAKDADSYSYSVRKYGPQQKTDPHRPDAGNGIRHNGRKIAENNPRDASIPVGASFMKEWILRIRETCPEALESGRILFALGNEPMLWNVTHRDVHAEPVSYDEYFGRFVAMATAVREAAPKAPILGPEVWGWPAYFESARDRDKPKRTDWKTHGKQPFLPWFLRSLREYEQEHDVSLLDILSVHYYPQAAGVIGADASRGACLSRVRGPRSLHDPRYKDPSWIDEKIRLIPRLRDWCREHHPGLEIAITEYNWGAEDHISGALALADALGIFAAENVSAAVYWQYPKPGSLAASAFSMYTDVDGQGTGFGQRLVPVEVVGSKSSRGSDLRLYAARGEKASSDVAVIAVNKAGSGQYVHLTFAGVDGIRLQNGYKLSPGATSIQSFDPGVQTDGNGVSFTVPPKSIYHLRFTPMP